MEDEEKEVEIVQEGKKERKRKQTVTHLHGRKQSTTFRKPKIIKHLEKII